MKKLIVLVCVALAYVAAASAQEIPSEATLVAAAAQPATTNMARPAPIRSGPKFASLTLLPTAPVAKPSAPEPTPAWPFDGREEDTWQLSTAYAHVRFRSTPFTASLNGIHTRVAKYFDQWFGVEGGATAAFAGVPSGFGPGSNAKYLFYGAGVRIRWPGQRRLEPWGHVVLGGVHMQPQTAGNSRSSFAYELGGGVDWQWKLQLAWRVQGDWVRSRLYQESQNNFQIATGIVFKF